MRLNQSTLLVTFSFLLVSCSGSRPQVKSGQTLQGEIVEAQGSAPFRPDDVPGTRAAALANASKAAVQIVVSVYVNPSTRAAKEAVIDERVLSEAARYVRRHEILSEERSGYEQRMRIRALVATHEVRQKLQSLGLLRQASFGQPKIGLLMQDYVKERPTSSDAALNALSPALVQKGFQIVPLPSSAGDDSDPLELARTLKRSTVELLLAGFARVQAVSPPKKKGAPSVFRTTLSFRVIETGSGEVLQTVLQQKEVSDKSAESALQRSLGAVAEMAAREIASLPGELSKRAQVSVTISGLKSFNLLAALQKSLAAKPGIKDLDLRSYNQEAGVAVLDVLADTVSPQEIADHSVKIGGADWSIYQVSGRTVQLSASQAGR